MQLLPIETKIIIASNSIAVWNGLMRADKAFAEYAMSSIGRQNFINTFTIVVEKGSKTT